MHAVHVPVLAAALVLLGAGLNKIRRPVPTSRAVRTLAGETPWRGSAVARAASSIAAVRALGAAELAIGAAVLATTSAAATWLLATLYAVFAAFVCAALATGAPLESCGCFGAQDRPPSATHVALCAAVAALAVAAVTDGGLGAPHDTFVASHGGGAVVSLAAAAVLWLALNPPVRRAPDSRA